MVLLLWHFVRLVIQLSRKKIIFFIVEGAADSTAIYNALEKIFDLNQVSIHVADGDITSDNSTTPQNIKKRIVEQIKNYFGSSVVKPSDFFEVVQLVDTDGVFIDDSKVVFDEVDKVYYGSDTIKCKNVQDIIERNKKKVAILNILIKLQYVWKTIPYSVYFFSSNMDHVLHDNSNLNDNEKVDKASNFAKKYENDTDGFIKFFSEGNYSINSNYNESWEFIKADSNSLKRFTKFNLLFTEKSKNNTNKNMSNKNTSA